MQPVIATATTKRKRGGHTNRAPHHPTTKFGLKRKLISGKEGP